MTILEKVLNDLPYVLELRPDENRNVRLSSFWSFSEGLRLSPLPSGQKGTSHIIFFRRQKFYSKMTFEGGEHIVKIPHDDFNSRKKSSNA